MTAPSPEALGLSGSSGHSDEGMFHADLSSLLRSILCIVKRSDNVKDFHREELLGCFQTGCMKVA